MLLKIFTKKEPGGKLVNSDQQWDDTHIEGVSIKKKVTEQGFKFLVEKSNGTSEEVTVDISVQGYEIFNDHGNSIEKVVATTVKPFGTKKMHT